MKIYKKKNLINYIHILITLEFARDIAILLSFEKDWKECTYVAYKRKFIKSKKKQH